jgi:hypothetical protein
MEGAKPNHTDPALENGPLTKRGCTDCLCCIIFIIAWFGFVYIIAWGFAKGDPWNLAQPFDVDGNACGSISNSNTKDYPLALFYSPSSSLGATICVKSCPMWSVNASAPTSIGECYMGSQAAYETGYSTTNVTAAPGKIVCDKNIQLFDFTSTDTALTALGLVRNLKIFRSTPFIERFCLPDLTNATDTAKTYYNNLIKGTAAE